MGVIVCNYKTPYSSVADQSTQYYTGLGKKCLSICTIHYYCAVTICVRPIDQMFPNDVCERLGWCGVMQQGTKHIKDRHPGTDARLESTNEKMLAKCGSNKTLRVCSGCPTLGSTFSTNTKKDTTKHLQVQHRKHDLREVAATASDGEEQEGGGVNSNRCYDGF